MSILSGLLEKAMQLKEVLLAVFNLQTRILERMDLMSVKADEIIAKLKEAKANAEDTATNVAELADDVKELDDKIKALGDAPTADQLAEITELSAGLATSTEELKTKTRAAADIVPEAQA